MGPFDMLRNRAWWMSSGEISPQQVREFTNDIVKPGSDAEKADVLTLTRFFKYSYDAEKMGAIQKSSADAARLKMIDLAMSSHHIRRLDFSNLINAAMEGQDKAILSHVIREHFDPLRTYLVQEEEARKDPKKKKPENPPKLRFEPQILWKEAVLSAPNTNMIDHVAAEMKAIGYDKKLLTRLAEIDAHEKEYDPQELQRMIKAKEIISVHDPEIMVDVLRKNKFAIAVHIKDTYDFTWPDKEKIRQHALEGSAIENGNLPMFRMFVEEGFKPTPEMLCKALEKKQLHIADYLVSQGIAADPKKDKEGNLWLAAIGSNDTQSIQWLVDKGFDKNFSFSYRDHTWPALYHALNEKNPIAAEALMKLGATPLEPKVATELSKRVEQLRTPESVHLNRLLLEMGANPNAVIQENGKTVFHYVIQRHYPPMVQLYIKHGATPNNPIKLGTDAKIYLEDPYNALKQHHIYKFAKNYENKTITGFDLLELSKKACTEENTEALNGMKKQNPDYPQHMENFKTSSKTMSEIETVERMLQIFRPQSLNLEHAPEGELLSPLKTPQKPASPLHKKQAVSA